MSDFPLGARPGTKIDFVAERQPVVLPSFSETVAVAITHDWGPIDQPALCTSFDDYIAKFGDSDTPGRLAVAQAFSGQRLLGAAGAGGVVVERMALTSGGGQATASSVVIQNTAPAAAITLTAKYKGAYGNRLSYVTRDDPTNAARNILEIRLDGVVRERFYYTDTDITDLAAQITAGSSYVVPSAVTSGTALAVSSGASLAGGTDGAALTATEWTRGMVALESQVWSIFAPFDLTDGSIQASVVAWIQGLVAAGKPVMAVMGGSVFDSMGLAIARSAAWNEPHVINLGQGVYQDTVLNKGVTTSTLAPRIAGVLAARGDDRSLTFAKLGGLSIVSNAPANDVIAQGIENGVTVLSAAASVDAPTKIERGITSFVSRNDPVRSYKVHSDPRLVRLMDNFQRGMQEWGDDKVIGNSTVTDNTRAAVRGEAARRIQSLEDRGLIVPDTGFVNVTADPNIPDSVPFEFGWIFTQTSNYIRGRGRVR